MEGLSLPTASLMSGKILRRRKNLEILFDEYKL